MFTSISSICANVFSSICKAAITFVIGLFGAAKQTISQVFYIVSEPKFAALVAVVALFGNLPALFVLCTYAVIGLFLLNAVEFLANNIVTAYA